MQNQRLQNSALVQMGASYHQHSFSPNLPYHSIYHQHESGGAVGTSTQNRSTNLGNIQENEDTGPDVLSTSQADSYRPSHACSFAASMIRSRRGALARLEGPNDGSQEGLLHSIYGAPNELQPTDLTAADMCFSTLYLHELHHRQIRRRGIRSDHAQQRHQWQSPHQHQSSQRSTTSHTSLPGTSAASTSTTSGVGAVENTPLLGTKKS